MKEFLDTYNVFFLIAFISVIPIVVLLDLDRVRLKLYDSIIACGMVIVLTYLFGSREFTVGTDTPKYVLAFEYIWKTNSLGEALSSPFFQRDPYFNLITYFFSRFVDIRTYFYILAFLFVFPLYVVANRVGKQDKALVLLSFVSLFILPNLGINIIRNGLSFSFALLALTYFKDSERKKGVFFAVISVLFHLSSILILAAFFCARFVKKTWPVIVVFVGSAVLALLRIGVKDLPYIGEVIQQSERISSYSSVSASQSAYTSALPLSYLAMHVATIWFAFYMDSRMKDPFYRKLSTAYVFLTSFYFLCSTMAFSYRFGMISWVLIPIIMVYPFVNNKGGLGQLQHIKLLGTVLLLQLFSLYHSNV